MTHISIFSLPDSKVKVERNGINPYILSIQLYYVIIYQLTYDSFSLLIADLGVTDMLTDMTLNLTQKKPFLWGKYINLHNNRNSFSAK